MIRNKKRWMRWWQVGFQSLTEDALSFRCWCECRFCLQVHRFMRGRTIRKRRERLTAEHTVTRVDVPPNKVRNLTQTHCCYQGLVNYERILSIELSCSQAKGIWGWCILHSPFLKFENEIRFETYSMSLCTNFHPRLSKRLSERLQIQT